MEIKSYLPEVNLSAYAREKVEIKILILNSRKYEVVVVGQK